MSCSIRNHYYVFCLTSIEGLSTEGVLEFCRMSGNASNNIQTLGRLNAGRDVSVVVRVDTDLPPEGLRQAAEHAAHSGDLRSRHPADLAAHARSPWDELRVWDPGE